MIDKYPSVSVSIVTFNNAEILESRLRALLPIFKSNQISNVYIIDNCSTDKTKSILKEFAKFEPLLNLIFLDVNSGFGFGHNQAIKKTDSQYHVVMNLDVTPVQNEIFDSMGRYMEIHRDVDLLSPLVLFPDNSIQRLTRNEPTVFDLAIRFLGPNWFEKRQRKFTHWDDGYDREQIIKNATGCFMFLRTSTLKHIGGFDERYFLYMEDTDLTKSINEEGKALFSPEFKIMHEWQRGNHSIVGAKLMIISMIKYFNKWGWCPW